MAMISEEIERAAGDPACLLIGHSVRSPTDAQSHRAKPNTHAATKLDVARARLHGLALEEEQDITGVGAVRKSKSFAISVQTALQPQDQVRAFAFPGQFLDRLVGQRRQS